MLRLKDLPDFAPRHEPVEFSQLSPMQNQKHAKLVRSDLYFGIEIESELWPAREANLGKWWKPSPKPEGSLKTPLAWEWVSEPLRGKALIHALMRYTAAAKVHDAHFTDRCGVHIHVNLLEFPVDALPALGLLTVAMDNVFYSLGNWERSWNYHCRPLSVTQPDVEEVAEMMRNVIERKDLRLGTRRRYLGTNWSALFRHGTLEFRHFPGEYRMRNIAYWINCVACLYTAAEKIPFQELVSLCQNPDITPLGLKVFGKRRWEKIQDPKIKNAWEWSRETVAFYLETLMPPSGDMSFHKLLQQQYII